MTDSRNGLPHCGISVFALICVLCCKEFSNKHTLNAAEGLRSFARPSLIAWGARDRFFPLRDAERLAEILPFARLEIIDDARTYVQFDQPERLANLLLEHVG